eukprot:COSAG04_NODE_2749_length_3644_cov_4.300705_2_plen_47_part_00
MDEDEAAVAQTCDEDPSCVAYDYAEDLNYGHLCSSTATTTATTLLH